MRLDTLDNFATDLQQEVLAKATGSEDFLENAFTETMIDYLSDIGYFTDAKVCHYRGTGEKQRIMKMNGYALSENEEDLDVFVTVHSNAVPPKVLTQTEIKQYFRWLEVLYMEAIKGFHKDLEESMPAFDALQTIYNIRTQGQKPLVRVRLILITDLRLSIKADIPSDTDNESIRINRDIWDIERLYRSFSSGKAREEIEIEMDDAIPCLVQPASNEEYASYLAIIPGTVLCDWYGKYGSQLLERNVRSFLQAKGKVNGGIRNTIKKEPEMFLAYNNGLSTTAESVEIVNMPGGGKGIKKLRDFQIVNGGQTTASLFYAVKRDKADISKVFVQTKLTVLTDASKMNEVIPRVSEYANSQNSIRPADLSANRPYHRSLEGLSRTVWAPAQQGTVGQTHWFYERARGQYQDEINQQGTPAKQKAWQVQNPKTQLFTKTDLSKFIMTWECQPYLVSKGGETCFTWYTQHLDEHLEKEKEKDGELSQEYFECVVAKIILFREAERVIKKDREQFHGYWANLVTYSVARLVHEAESKIDLRRIWNDQKVSPEIEKAILDIAKQVWAYIIDPTVNDGKNVTQFCKQVKCWEGFLKTDVYVEGGFQNLKQVNTTIYAVQKQRELITDISTDDWFRIAEWGAKNKLFGEGSTDYYLMLEIARKVEDKLRIMPSEATKALKILEKAQQNGFVLGTIESEAEKK
jgi:AIPR protein